MKILVDADACPKPVKEILKRAVFRLKIRMILVANTYIPSFESVLISSIKVLDGPDKADDRIVELTGLGDLIITADIPLADRVIEKGGFVITPYGVFLSKHNIKEKLAMRNFKDELRNSGVETKGFPPFGVKNKQAFAKELDSFLAKHLWIVYL